MVSLIPATSSKADTFYRFDLEKARICCRPQDEPSGTASPAVEVWMRTAQKADMKQAGPRQVKQMSKRLK